MTSHSTHLLLLISTLLIVSSCAQLNGNTFCPVGYNRAKAGNCVQDFSCQETQKCNESGKCTYAQDMCVATRQGDCSNSTNCTKLGECQFQLDSYSQGGVGLCVANVDGCARSEVCKKYGKCSPGDDGFCVVGGDEDCAESQLCMANSRCTAKRVPRADGKSSKVYSCQL